ncbi:MAG: sigma-70 family RNA polymerase sigma factor [Lentisphaerales bacterium]|nr:sigma-70 family RNA polymerase sigma factor [Lentisphaerales bacterium]
MEDFKKDMSNERNELFIRLLAEHERKLTRYVMALVPRISDAEDILQESKLVMWREFSQFAEGSNFNAWARKVIFYRILTYRKVKNKESERYIFSDAFYEVLGEEFDAGEERREKQFNQLQKCIGHLQPDHKTMIMLRYHEGEPIEKMAETIGRTVAACYKTLSRIRLNLKKCLLKSGAGV